MSSSRKENPVYLYNIKNNNKTILLNSTNSIIHHNGIVFYPYSSLEIVKTHFNNCATNYVIIKGIFDKDGIEDYRDILGSKFTIALYDSKTKSSNIYLNYYYYGYKSYDNRSFTIKIIPATYKFQNKLLNSYSFTCRANFGDHSCKIDIKELQYPIKATKIQNNYIYIESLPSRVINNKSYCLLVKDKKYMITDYKHNYITINVDAEKKIFCSDNLLIQDLCDKSFHTCCNIFKNAVNFRGEPFNVVNVKVESCTVANSSAVSHAKKC